MAILTFLTHPPTSLKLRFWQGAQSVHIIKMVPMTRFSGNRLITLTLHEHMLHEAQPDPLETFKILPSYVVCPQEGQTMENLTISSSFRRKCIDNNE